MATRKKAVLGRGLDQLLPTVAKREPAAGGDELKELDVELIQPGEYQPRSGMDPERLQELAASIKAQGVVQPIVVRPIGSGRYEIIAGERRWRAAQLARLSTIPSVIRDVPDQATMAMALIENIQREDLNPIEESNALKRLIDEFDLTHQEVADLVGRSRASVSNLLRLLDLAPKVLGMLEKGAIEMGHARALLSLAPSQQIDVARQVADKTLNVRQTEALVRKMNATPKASAEARGEPAADADIARLEQELTERLCARVKLKHQRSGKGQLLIEYNSADELDGILQRIQ